MTLCATALYTVWSWCIKRLSIKSQWLLLRCPVERAVRDDCWEKVACPGSVTARLVPCLGDSLWHQLSTAGTGPDTKLGWQHHTLSALLRTPPTSVTSKTALSWLKKFSVVRREFWVNDTFGLEFCLIPSLWSLHGKSKVHLNIRITGEIGSEQLCQFKKQQQFCSFTSSLKPLSVLICMHYNSTIRLQGKTAYLLMIKWLMNALDFGMLTFQIPQHIGQNHSPVGFSCSSNLVSK